MRYSDIIIVSFSCLICLGPVFKMIMLVISYSNLCYYPSIKGYSKNSLLYSIRLPYRELEPSQNRFDPRAIILPVGKLLTFRTLFADFSLYRIGSPLSLY